VFKTKRKVLGEDWEEQRKARGELGSFVREGVTGQASTELGGEQVTYRDPHPISSGRDCQFYRNKG